eukprot:5628512-Pleurochrysis_carterae.AAC.3
MTHSASVRILSSTRVSSTERAPSSGLRGASSLRTSGSCSRPMPAAMKPHRGIVLMGVARIRRGHDFKFKKHSWMLFRDLEPERSGFKFSFCEARGRMAILPNQASWRNGHSAKYLAKTWHAAKRPCQLFAKFAESPRCNLTLNVINIY